jgi:uncharacterized protein (DUF1501 family)
MSRTTLSRRDFLRLSCCSATGAALAAGMGRFGLVNAYAQTSGPYQALVCIFLFGGNDGNNMLIPFTTQGLADYATARTGLALAPNLMLPITPKTNNFTGPYPGTFALHPQMPNIQALFSSGKAALVTNVGTLVQPTTKTQYTGGHFAVPSNLFSHSDQQNQWQTSAPNSNGASGWAGRVADKLNPILNVGAQLPMIMSLAGANIFTTGLTTRPATVTPGNTSGFSNLDTTRSNVMQTLLTLDSGISLVQAQSAITNFAFSDSNHLAQALVHGTPLKTVFPNTGIGSQLKQVAQVIQVSSFLNMTRQIFFCSMGGFDTHNFQLTDQGSLLAQLDAAMSAFFNATVELNASNQVTAFTLSEFGRTLQESSGAGSDHAWGSHQIVVGGAVQGGDLYAAPTSVAGINPGFPSLVIGGPNDTGSNSGARGRWIPTTSLDQYAATLASWFGVSDADLTGSIFPDLHNFAPNIKLGFMG